MTTLYIVGTPIGNLDDITFRAVNILKEVAYIAAEDTRITRKLLSRYGIHSKMFSLNKDNAHLRVEDILTKIATEDIALVTDAGTPGLIDPAHELISAADERGYKIIAIPGPSSVTAAISLSPFPIHSFIFIGFPPRKETHLKVLFQGLLSDEKPFIFFESAPRIQKTLRCLGGICSDRSLLITRELTKMYEERFVGTAAEALDHYDNPRGEFTIIVNGGNSLDEEDIKHWGELHQKFRRSGITGRDAAIELSKVAGISKSRAYRFILAADDTLNTSQ